MARISKPEGVHVAVVDLYILRGSLSALNHRVLILYDVGCRSVDIRERCFLTQR